MPDLINGNCLCGKVEFEVEDRFDRFFLCHCEQCRKITGSAHASNLFADPKKFRWVSGEEFIKRFDLPGRSITKAFCLECGSGVPYMNASGTAVLIPAGSLNSEPHFSSQDKIFYAEQTEWHRAAEDAKTFDQFPE